MPALMRVMVAFVSLLVAVLGLGLVAAIPAYARYGMRQVTPILEILPVYLAFAIPGLLLALPFILLFRDASGPRLWWTLAIGIAVGPAFIVSWILLASGGRLDWQANGFSVVLSVIIGTSTTVYYVMFLRLFAMLRMRK